MAGRPKKIPTPAPSPLPQGGEYVVRLRNRGTAEHVRLCERPDRASRKVGLVWAGETIRYGVQMTGALLGEHGDQWVPVETEDGLNGYIHRSYLVLPEDTPLPSRPLSDAGN